MPALDLEAIQQRLKPLAPELQHRFRAELIGVFGSFARGEQTPTSDIDILVRFGAGATLLDLVACAEFLETALGRSVDLVSERAVRPELKAQIMAEVMAV